MTRQRSTAELSDKLFHELEITEEITDDVFAELWGFVDADPDGRASTAASASGCRPTSSASGSALRNASPTSWSDSTSSRATASRRTASALSGRCWPMPSACSAFTERPSSTTSARRHAGRAGSAHRQAPRSGSRRNAGFEHGGSAMTFENPTWMQGDTYSARVDRQFVSAVFSEGVLDGFESPSEALAQTCPSTLLLVRQSSWATTSRTRAPTSASALPPRTWRCQPLPARTLVSI